MTERAGEWAIALETVIIFTQRMEELAAFYREGLGLGPFQRAPRHMGQRVGSIYLGFDQVDDAGRSDGRGPSLWFTVDDTQATYDRLMALGAEPRYSPRRTAWGGVLGSVYDPDGNIVGLSERRQRERGAAEQSE